MPQYEVLPPLRYINGVPHYKGQVITLTSGEFSALSNDDKAALRSLTSGLSEEQLDALVTDVELSDALGNLAGGVDAWDDELTYDAGSEVTYDNAVWSTAVEVEANVEPGRPAAAVRGGSTSPGLNTAAPGAATARFNQPFTPTSTMVIDRVRHKAVLTAPELSNLELRLGTTAHGAEVATSSPTLFSKVDQDIEGWVTWTLAAPVTLNAGTTYHLNSRTSNTAITYGTGTPVPTGLTLGTLTYGHATLVQAGSIPGEAVVFELIKTQVTPWTKVVQGSTIFRGAWSPTKAFEKNDLVIKDGSLFAAIMAAPIGIVPSLIDADYNELNGGFTGSAAGTLSQSQNGVAFTPNKAITVGVIRVYAGGSGTYTNARAGISMGVGTGTFAYVAVSATKSGTVANGGYVDFVLAAPITLAANVKVWIVAENFPYTGYTTSTAAVNGTYPGDASRYGMDLSSAWTNFPFTFQLRSPLQTQPWRLLSSGYSADGDNNAVLKDGGLLVGDASYGVNANGVKMFFQKARRAFRSGSFSGSSLDNLGMQSAAFGDSSEATGTSAFAAGASAKANALGAAAFGSAVTTGTYGFAAGQATTASAGQATALGDGTTASGAAAVSTGQTTTASGQASLASGIQSAARRRAEQAHASGQFSAVGDAQCGRMVLMKSTSNATPAVLTAQGGAVDIATAGAHNVLTVTVSRVLKVRVNVAARRQDTAVTEAAGWTFDLLIARDSTGNARIVGDQVALSWNDAAAAAWDVTLSIDSSNATNNYLVVTVTGEAKTIRWVANVEWVEVG